MCTHRTLVEGTLRKFASRCTPSEFKAEKIAVVWSFCKVSAHNATLKIEVYLSLLRFMRHDFQPAEFLSSLRFPPPCSLISAGLGNPLGFKALLYDETTKSNWQRIFLRILRWNSVESDKLMIKTLLRWELFLPEKSLWPAFLQLEKTSIWIVLSLYVYGKISLLLRRHVFKPKRYWVLTINVLICFLFRTRLKLAVISSFKQKGIFVYFLNVTARNITDSFSSHSLFRHRFLVYNYFQHCWVPENVSFFVVTRENVRRKIAF